MSEPAMSLPLQDHESLPESPFPGIEAFTYARHRVFFAREEETRTLSRSIVLHRGVLLYAASGTGKSSLINAGIIPRAIEEGFRPERVRVQPKVGQEIVVEPIRAFADERETILPSIFIAGHEQLERVVLSVEEFVNCLRKNAGTVRTLLIFDQFEEWVTLFEEASTEQNRPLLKASRERVQTAISDLINDTTLPVKVLIALREDYLANLDPIFRDVPSLPDNFLRLRPLSSNQLIDVIRKPYEKYPGAFAVDLSLALANNIRDQFEQRVAGGDIQLTEVQIVCRTLFDHGTKGGNADQLFGQKGVQGILEAYLETTLDKLAAGEREPALAVLSRLITSSGTRNVVSEDNLIRWLGTEEKIPREVVRTAVRNLEHSARLIRCEPRRGVNYYEINSEFLVPWIQREAAARETRREVEALRRQQEKEHKAFRQKLRLRAAYVIAAAVILLATVAFVRGRTQEKMHLHSVAEALAVKSLMDSGEVGNLLASQAEAINRKDTSYFSGLIGTALANALTSPPAPLGKFSGVISSLSTDTGGKVLAAAANGRALVWDLDKPRAIPREFGELEFAHFQAVAISRDGSKLVAADRRGRVFLWRLRSLGAEPIKFSGDTGTVHSLDLSPDGRRIAAASRDGTVRIWDVDQANRPPILLNTSGIMGWSLRFDNDENTLFTGSLASRGGVQKWDLRSSVSKPVTTIEGLSLGISADGKLLATGALDGKVRVWRIADLKTPVYEYAPHHGAILSVTFSRDGTALASTGADSTVQLWSLEQPQPIRVMIGRHNGWPMAAHFSRDGNSLVSGGTDGQLKWWFEVRGKKGYPLTVARPRGDSGSVSAAVINTPASVVASVVSKSARRSVSFGGTEAPSFGRVVTTANVWLYDLAKDKDSLQFGPDSISDVALALSGDGKSLAAIGRGGLIRFVRRDNPGIETVFGQPQDSIKSIALSMNGLLLAGAGNDSVVRVWNTLHPAKAPTRLRGAAEPIRSLAFSPDGKRLAAGDRGGTVRIWTIAQPDTALKLEAHEDVVRALTFSSDGNLLASGGDDGNVSIWNLAAAHKLLVVFPTGESEITTVSFRQDGRLVFAGSEDGTIRYWSIEDRSMSPVRLTTQSGAVRALGLSAGADTLYSIGDNGAVLGWLLNGGALAKRICGRVSKNLSIDEWRFYVPAEMEYRLICPEHGSPPANVEAIKKVIRQGDFENARRMRKMIAKLDSSQTYDVEAGIMFYQSEELARRKQVDSAIVLARRAGIAARRDSVQGRDGFDRVGTVLVERANVLADSGHFREAGQLVSKVRALLPKDSKLAARTVTQIIEPVFLDPSIELAKAGKVDSALVAFGEARSAVRDNEIPAVYWNNLCWYASLWSQPQKVASACEQGVRMEPLDGNYRDTRGLAKALMGDSEGAIKDFQFFIDWTGDEKLKAERASWIAILRAKRNPFTPERLQALRSE